MSAITSNVTVKLEDGVSGPARTMGSSMSQLEQKSKQSFGAMTQSAQRAQGQVKRTAAEMNAARTASIGMAGGIAGLGASFVALETTMTNIPKRLKAIEQAEVAMARVQDTVATKNLALKKMEVQLQKAREGGKKTNEEIALIEEKMAVTRQQLTTYTRDLAVKQEDLNLKNADYADTLKLMATSVFTTFLTAGTSVMIMLTGMATNVDMTTGKFISMKLGVLANSRVLRLLGVDLKAAGLALRGTQIQLTAIGLPATVAVHGIRRVGLAFKGLYLAMGPIGWAIIGLTTAYEVLAFNIGGAADALHWFVDEVVKLIPALQGLKELVQWLFPETEEGAEASAEALAEEADAMAEIERQAELASAEIERMIGANSGLAAGAVPAGIAVQGLSREIGSTASAIAQMWGVWRGEGARDALERSRAMIANLQYLKEQGVAPATREFQQMSAIVVPELKSIGEALQLAAGPEAFAELKAAVQDFGIEAAAVFSEIKDGPIAGFRSALGKTAELVQTMWDIKGGAAERDIEDRAQLITAALIKMKEDGIDPLSPAFKALTRDVLPDLQRFGDELYDILGEQAFLEYEHNIRALSWEYGHSMNSAMAAVRGLGNEFDVLKKKSTAAAGRQGRLSAYRDSEAISEAVRRQRQREIIGFRGDSINITGYDAKGNFITRTFRSRIMAPSKTTFGGFSGELVRQFSAGVGIDKLAGLGRRLAGGHESRSTGNQVGPTRAGLTRATGRRHRGGHHPDPLGWFTALARIASPHGSVQGVVGAHGWAAMSQNLDLAAQVGVDLMEAVRRAAYSWNLNFNRGGGNNIAPHYFAQAGPAAAAEASRLRTA